MFINDVDEYFRQKGVLGLNVNSYNGILLIVYVDDIVNVANFATYIYETSLEKYCDYFKLQVNAEE